MIEDSNSEEVSVKPKREAIASLVIRLEECPLCNKNTVVVVGHCKTCQDCGWSSCDL